MERCQRDSINATRSCLDRRCFADDLRDQLTPAAVHSCTVPPPARARSTARTSAGPTPVSPVMRPGRAANSSAMSASQICPPTAHSAGCRSRRPTSSQRPAFPVTAICWRRRPMPRAAAPNPAVLHVHGRPHLQRRFPALMAAGDRHFRCHRQVVRPFASIRTQVQYVRAKLNAVRFDFACCAR
jgi:hypothetical protein